MTQNFDREKEQLFGEIPDSPQPYLENPGFLRFFSGTRKRQVGRRIAFNNISNFTQSVEAVAEIPNSISGSKRTRLQSVNQVSPCVPTQRPSTKKPVKQVPQKNEAVNLEPDSDKGTTAVCISDSSYKKSCPAMVTAGIIDNYTHQIDDIDLPDVNNQLAVVEYVEDLYTFYKKQQHIRRPADNLKNQIHVNDSIRAIVVGQIIQIHHKFALLPETLYLSVYIMDRYLSLTVVLKSQLYLVGICALLIASKYEENYAPQVCDFIEIAKYKYTQGEIIRMEKAILNKLEWYLTVPTAYMFLVRYIKAAKADKELEHMVYFFAELALIEYGMMNYCPSMVAASAVYTARCTLRKFPLWTATLQRHTSYSESDLLQCAQVLADAHLAAPLSKYKLRVVYKKYTHEQFEGVACYPPATSLIKERNSGAPASS